ncbi:MAG: NmrA family NAD(P)-binding protein [Bacteroidota bacterium]
MEKIMLFNATGMQGATIAAHLTSLGHQIVAPVRSAQRLKELQSKGFTAFETDYSIASLSPQMEKVDKVLLQIPAQISPSEMVSLTSRCVDAILAADYPDTVFVISSTLPDAKVGVPSVDARVEMKNLSLSKLPKTPILSATEYLENFSTAYRHTIESDGVIPQTIPANYPVNYLSWSDLAHFTSAALFSNVLEGKLYRIGGNEGITGYDLAERLGQVINKNLRYAPITHDQLAGFLTPILGESVAKDYAEFYEYQDTRGQELLNPNTKEIRKVLGLTLPQFEEWAQKAFKN